MNSIESASILFDQYPLRIGIVKEFSPMKNSFHSKYSEHALIYQHQHHSGGQKYRHIDRNRERKRGRQNTPSYHQCYDCVLCFHFDSF